MKGIFFCRKAQLFKFIEVGCGKEKLGLIDILQKLIPNSSQDLRNCSYTWGYARTAIRHNAAAAFSFRLNRLPNVQYWFSELKIWFKPPYQFCNHSNKASFELISGIYF